MEKNEIRKYEASAIFLRTKYISVYDTADPEPTRARSVKHTN